MIWVDTMALDELAALVENKIAGGRCDYCGLRTVEARALRFPGMHLKQQREAWKGGGTERAYAHLVFAVEFCAECANRLLHPRVELGDRAIPGGLVHALIDCVAEWSELQTPGDDSPEA